MLENRAMDEIRKAASNYLEPKEDSWETANENRFIAVYAKNAPFLTEQEREEMEQEGPDGDYDEGVVKKGIIDTNRSITAREELSRAADALSESYENMQGDAEKEFMRVYLQYAPELTFGERKDFEYFGGEPVREYNADFYDKHNAVLQAADNYKKIEKVVENESDYNDLAYRYDSRISEAKTNFCKLYVDSGHVLRETERIAIEKMVNASDVKKIIHDANTDFSKGKEHGAYEKISSFDRVIAEVDIYETAVKAYNDEFEKLVKENEGRDVTAEQTAEADRKLAAAEDRLSQVIDDEIFYLEPEEIAALYYDERLEDHRTGILDGFGTDAQKYSPAMHSVREALHEYVAEEVFLARDKDYPLEKVEDAKWQARRTIEEKYLALSELEKAAVSDFNLVKKHSLDANAKINHAANEVSEKKAELELAEAGGAQETELTKSQEALQKASKSFVKNYEKNCDSLTELERSAILKNKEIRALAKAENMKMSEINNYSMTEREKRDALETVGKDIDFEKEEMKQLRDEIRQLSYHKTLDSVATVYQLNRDKLTQDERNYVKAVADREFNKNSDPRNDKDERMPEIAKKGSFDATAFIEKANIYEIVDFHNSRHDKEEELKNGDFHVRLEPKRQIKDPFNHMMRESEKIRNSKDIVQFIDNYERCKNNLSEQEKKDIFEKAEKNLKSKPNRPMGIVAPESVFGKDFNLRKMVEKGDVKVILIYDEELDKKKEKSFFEAVKKLKEKVKEKLMGIVDRIRGKKKEEMMMNGHTPGYMAVKNSLDGLENEVQKYNSAVIKNDDAQYINSCARNAAVCQKEFKEMLGQHTAQMTAEERREIEMRLDKSKLTDIKSPGLVRAEEAERHYQKAMQLQAYNERVREQRITKERSRVM